VCFERPWANGPEASSTGADPSVLPASDIRRVHLGHFTRPEGDEWAGQKIVVVAYLIRHPDGLVLFDTGIGEGHAEAERVYPPVRRSFDEALATAGVGPDDVDVVVNCHLHFDHSGNNFRFPGIPLFMQRVERENAEGPDYTIPQVVVDFPGSSPELLDGEAGILPGVRIVPTPGHTSGHQSVLVETDQGTIVLAGQAFNATSDFARAQFAWQLEATGSPEAVTYPDWIRRFQEFDPWRVLFAHDVAVWGGRPSAGRIGALSSRPQSISPRPFAHDVA
jgi:N-acyl homoserine lactone hydrolase